MPFSHLIAVRPATDGQVWLEDVEKCVKFRRIVSGDEKDIVEEDSNGKKKCRDGFIWVPSLKMCAKRPKFCNNAACVEVKKPKSQKDCLPNREWNPAKRKCLKPKQVETIFTEKPET